MEETRQKWIGITFDLVLAYYDAQNAVCSEWNNAEHPDELIKTMSRRIADAVGDDATADFVYESIHKRLRDRSDDTSRA